LTTPLNDVLDLFVSAASTTAALSNRPDPPPDQAQDPAAGHAPAPSRTGRLLGLLHKLIDYGKDLAHTLGQRTTAAAAPCAATRHFGTLTIALILARIVRGLRLATALEARLVSHPLREAAAPVRVRAPSDHAPRIAQPAAPRASRAASRLPEVPTAAEIAAALRHRPAGAVIADICRDLGIVPAHPLWGEVMMVVTEFGGNLTTLVKDVVHRLYSWCADPSVVETDASPAPWSQAAAACGTGPP
jgi:hypothetical protein